MSPCRSRSRVRSPVRTALVVLLAGTFVPAGPSPASETTLPSIVAEHVRRHVPSGTELVRVRLELSPAGLRVRERSGGRDLELFQDFAAGRLWFVDRSRRIAHAVEPGGPAADAPTGRAATIAGLLGTTPCEGRDAIAAGDEIRRGRVVSSWECLDSGGTRVATELLDAELGIVVRRGTPDGIVDELRDIRERTFDAGHFSPPSRFRRVDERELLLGAPAIAAFDEARDATAPSLRSSVSRDRPHDPDGAGGER